MKYEDDDFLEQQIRSLRPSPMPADLSDRLAEPPPGGQRSSSKIVAWSTAIGLAAAACVAILASRGGNQDMTPTPEAPAVSVHQKNSELLGRRKLAFREIDGQLWEIVEEEWRDDSLAMCSSSPVSFRSTEKRKEIVCAPVEFL